MLSFLLLGRSNKERGNKERLTTDKRSQRNGGTNIVYKSFVTRRSRRKKTFAKTSRFFHYFRSIFVVEGSWRKREKNIQEIPIPVFASSSAGSLKPREERISRHRHYTFYRMTTRKIFIGPQIRAAIGWWEGFSLFVIFITSNQLRVTSKPDKDLSFVPTWIIQTYSVLRFLFFLIILDTPWLIPC